MRIIILTLMALLVQAQTIPIFTSTFAANGQQYSYTMVGQDPELGGTTTVPTVVVPVVLTFETSGGKVVLDGAPVISELVRSPLFEPYPFANGRTQYGDAVQRAQFHAKNDWHVLLGEPERSKPVAITIPRANGYLLHSKRNGASLGVVDLDFVQKAVMEQTDGTGKFVIAVTRNAAFYALGDATVCCSVGTHERALVIGSYFDEGVMPGFSDIQGITQQVGEWLNDPLHDTKANQLPRWLEPTANLICGGKGESSAYLQEQPTDFVRGRNALVVTKGEQHYHLENLALLSWFEQSPNGPYSFPDTKALTGPARPCSGPSSSSPTAAPLPRGGGSKHALIGYWEGYSSARSPTPLRDVSPQWDIVIATFATPVKGSTSLLHFSPPAALGDGRFKADVKYLQGKGKKVLISLGGGGEVVTLNTPEDLQNFVTSVTAIVEKYGFDGVDLDIETPSLLINTGDTDFRKPTTPSIVNLITAMHQLHEHFGAKFMIAEVPEAAQAQAGMQVYGGQFGSFLPVIYGTRDILSFVDAQDYNTPPLEGLDGNYYFPGNADYHVALSEMLVHGFPVGGDVKAYFPPLPAEKVAMGLPATPTSARNYTEISAIEDALRYLIEGKSYERGEYKLQIGSGYPGFMGAMFWAINEDRRNNYKMSNAVGSFLHNLP